MKNKTENKFVEVFSGTTWQSIMVKSLLKNAGIESFMKDGIMGTLSPWWTAPGGAGAVAVFVSSDDYDEAKEIVLQFEATQQ